MSKFFSKQNKLLSNIISLIILQGSNYIFPLITFPFLVRSLGVENYGILVFCVAIMQFLNVFVDFGFNISGTREISINKIHHNKVNETYNVILTVKIIISVIVGLIYFLVVEVFPLFDGNKITYLIGYLIIFGNTLFPLWLYQGLEKMKYITYINIVAKAIVTILIFVFINGENDLNLAVFFQTLYFVIPGVFSIFFVKKNLNIKFEFIIDVNRLISELKKGKYIFMTNLWINFYNQGPIVILGFISGNTSTGRYGIGQKIQSAFFGLSQPITQAVYPYLCDLYENRKEKFNKFRKKLLVFGLIFSITISVMLCFFSPFLVKVVYGSSSPQITSLIRFFSVIVFLGVMNTIMARIAYAMNRSKGLNKIYLIAAILFMISSGPLTLWLHEFGMALVVIISEVIIFILNLRHILKINEDNI
ncbi:PST family polysaccharide transporter [Pullulanibacillus pueri]|uniref:Teichoic acid transporter n=1 Tax=Pullulanibacillus pueri TaxID=1437324 RepID=A0A8J2ZWU3_9BACL|nr:flippase [Pullulanibacillus pueri]MBM7681783.1 PST family polysaccharide transporter [Pullulanibacillus pueri]GGH84230.1 teichoic acid transporter [Pullulanibacillus pueri]